MWLNGHNIKAVSYTHLAFLVAVVVISVVGADPARVTEVTEQSPAAEAGLQPGDIITRYEGCLLYTSFTVLLNMKRDMEKEGKRVIDLSVGTPNIPPSDAVIQALVEAAADRKNYIYAIKDMDELHQAVADWYRRRYGVEIDPDREVVSLLGSQEGLAHFALTVIDEGDTAVSYTHLDVYKRQRWGMG